MAKLNDVLPDALAGMIKEAAKQSGLKANLAFVQKYSGHNSRMTPSHYPCCKSTP